MTLKEKVVKAQRKVALAQKGEDKLKLRAAMQSLAAWAALDEQEFADSSRD